MKTYIIDADGNALLVLKVEGEKVELINAMNGWGENIKDKVIIVDNES